jgi:hypothetical protein
MVVVMTSQIMKNDKVNTVRPYGVKLNAARIMAETINFVTQFLIHHPDQNAAKEKRVRVLPQHLKIWKTQASLSPKGKLGQKVTTYFHEKHSTGKASARKSLRIALSVLQNPQHFVSTPVIKLFSKINTKQIQKIPPRLFRQMPLEQLQEIAMVSSEKLTTKQILELMMRRSWVLSRKLIQKVPAKDIQKIPVQNIHNMTPQILKMMSPEQFKNITPQQIHAMRPIQMCAMTLDHIQVMTQQQIKALQPCHIAALTNEQIFALFTSGKLINMTERQFSEIPVEVRHKIHLLKTHLFPKHCRRRRERIA